MTLVPAIALVIAIIAVAIFVDRLLLFCERRGWIYYRRAPRPGQH